MLKVGLTGNIGSGKTIVARIFNALGIAVFHADPEARRLFEREEVKAMLRGLFGDGIFADTGSIDRRRLAAVVFPNPVKLAQLNQIVHPLVREAFGRWTLERTGNPYVLYEAAILFESGYNRDLDKIILVTAPEEMRVSRVMGRDGVSREEVINRMSNQWEEEKKISMADFIIRNDGTEMLTPQVMEIHRALLAGCG